MTDENQPRPYTSEEVADQFLRHVAFLASYWAREGDTKLDACNGFAFSLLAMIDGSSMDLPAFDLFPAPHEEDEEFAKQNGENWYVPEPFNANMGLHERWSKYQRSE